MLSEIKFEKDLSPDQRKKKGFIYQYETSFPAKRLTFFVTYQSE